LGRQIAGVTRGPVRFLPSYVISVRLVAGNPADPVGVHVQCLALGFSVVVADGVAVPSGGPPVLVLIRAGNQVLGHVPPGQARMVPGWLLVVGCRASCRAR
jgi:hypothetical protein